MDLQLFDFYSRTIKVNNHKRTQRDAAIFNIVMSLRGAAFAPRSGRRSNLLLIGQTEFLGVCSPALQHTCPPTRSASELMADGARERSAAQVSSGRARALLATTSLFFRIDTYCNSFKTCSAARATHSTCSFCMVGYKGNVTWRAEASSVRGKRSPLAAHSSSYI